MDPVNFGSMVRGHNLYDAGNARQRRLSKKRPQQGADGLLISGGLDSCILLKHLLDLGQQVQPFYIRNGLRWQATEQRALTRYLDAVDAPQLRPLVVLTLPLADVYGDHWSMTGRHVPEAAAPDKTVFLPGRNALLSIKAALWCHAHDISQLAIATIRSNPFEDASASAFDRLGRVLSGMGPHTIRLTRPFGELDKQQVMSIGRNFPLHLTFSCIAPRRGAHCGRCNKCAERQAAFRLIGAADPTSYASCTSDSRLTAANTTHDASGLTSRDRGFHVGDHVEWNTPAGRVRGTIRTKITSEIIFKGYGVHASKEEPQYLIKGDKSDYLAIHTSSALTKL